MKVIPISAEHNALHELLALAQQTELILQTADGTQYFLARLTDSQAFYIGDDADFEQEITTTRQNKLLMDFLDERGTKAKKGQNVSLAEVKRRLNL